MHSSLLKIAGVALLTVLSPADAGAQLGSGAIPSGPPAPRAEDNSTAAAPDGVIALPQALALALKQNPELATFSWEARAREAAALQAGSFPNPEFSAEAENLGNSRLQALDGTAATFRFSQAIELGGKRAKRLRLAGIERELARWDYEIKRLDILTETRKAFTQVLAAQERRRLATELASVAEQVRCTVAERVNAGRVSPLEETKAEVAAANSRLQQKRAFNALEAARAALAALWGDTEARFGRAQGEIGVLAPIPTLHEIQHLVTRNPSVARWVAEIEQRRVAITLAEAKRVPDITLSAGVRQFTDTGDTAFVTGFSVPLPVFDRNDRGIQGSLYRFRQAQEEERAVEVKARAQLEQDHRILSTAHEETLTLRDEILPAAQRAFEAANEGYRHGKFSYLEVLDAQRTWFETRLRYLGALTAYQIAAAELERLIGAGLAQLAPARDVKKEGDR